MTGQDMTGQDMTSYLELSRGKVCGHVGLVHVAHGILYNLCEGFGIGVRWFRVYAVKDRIWDKSFKN